MTVFNEDGPMGYAEESRVCKRDYEKLIKDQQTKNAASIGLLDSLYHYLNVNNLITGGRKSEFTLPSLVGSLELEIKYGKKVVENLIKEQEKDNQ
jgi:hypothetical protein